jgi:hypothetical protein
MEKKKILIPIAISLSLSIIIAVITVFSGPVIKIEYSEADIAAASRMNSLSEYDEDEMIAFLKDRFPKMEKIQNEVGELKVYGYDIQYTDVDGDTNNEAVFTGYFGVPAVVLKKNNGSFKMLYHNDSVYRSDFKKDSYGNLCFNFSFTDLAGAGYYEEVVLRWDGEMLKEIWRGVTEYYRVALRGNGEEWFKNNGIYEITGRDKMELKYIVVEASGTIDGLDEKVTSEKTTVKRYTFDEDDFRFVEK